MRKYEAYSVREKKLPYFEVSGGPFDSTQIMGWHLVDSETGLTAGVSCDDGLCQRLNAMEVIARMFKRYDLYYLISNNLHDSGYLRISDEEWNEFREAARSLK